MQKKRAASNSRPVYSTEHGRLCPQCHRAVLSCACGNDRPTANGDGIVRVRRETKGRGGKAVTIIDGLPLADDARKALAKLLKKSCGVGGSVKGSTIEMQGDVRNKVKAQLEQRGYTVKLAGG
ncbi:MAG: translation initiation factor Sui1 [Pseudomonadota bacterium]